MRLLRDCLYRSKKSGTSNDDTRSGAPNWSSWEVHNGVTGGWKDYPSSSSSRAASTRT
jgi:hypothetical protein